MANNKMTMLSVALLLCGALLFLSSQMPAAEAHNLPDLQQLLESTGIQKQETDITDEEESLLKKITDIYEEHDKTADHDDHEHVDHADWQQRLSKLTTELKEAVKHQESPKH